MSTSSKRLTLWALLLAGVFAFEVGRVVADPASNLGVLDANLANGISADIYSAQYLAARLESQQGSRGVIRLDDGRYLPVITDVSDPAIPNKGDGQFHPFDVDEVLKLLGEIQLLGLDLHVVIYMLPYPRTNVLASSVSGRELYLSPHVSNISREVAAYIVAHEMGHVFQNRYMPLHAQCRWDYYRYVRDIEDRNRYSSAALHADRPVEIFAEDFRVLFGGPDAFFGGRIENPYLPSPVRVTGLRDFFRQLVTGLPGEPMILGVRNYPNPFNPTTQIRIQLSLDFLESGRELAIRVYDVRGALVRELYRDRPERAELQVTWDGLDRNGREVASSTYFGVVRAGDYTMTQKLLMIK